MFSGSRLPGLAVLVLVLAAAAGLGWWLLAPSSTPAGGKPKSRLFPVDVAVATLRPVVDMVETMGTTRAREAVDIRPLSGGRLVELNFKPGDRVEQGAVLARLDSETQEAARAEAEANLIDAERALKRARSLRQSQAVSQSAVDELETRRDSARARLEAAEKDLSERTVRAPFSGVVGFNEFDVGALVPEGQRLTTLDDLSVIQVIFQVPERYYGRLTLGQTVNATTPAFPHQTFAARVSHIDSRILEETRAFRVRATHGNDRHPLPSGLTVNVEIVLETREALMVPEEGVVAEAAGPMLFVIREDETGQARAWRRPVRTGLRTENAVEILEGLEEGERIARLGVQRLQDGMPVRIVAPAEAPPQAPAETPAGTSQGTPPETPPGAGSGTPGSGTPAPTSGQ
ncbi:efflux RND transporter periplasmic adaptor subunit [Phaeovibrio sulfidiphilus]|uniref:Efflux RND transporter periplasmic adaptor subunit n=1 Tax=Phaeovibrio sulfidiphilus TaxID=1220600 RepID=A0A8J6YL82_9PROT|nr:efflux RND transporter periplasmic adaptor subunit [Phaeovibrio sulfidiphilus]MBE1236613.1 efflux RND transporter periplasmic adaptor subunit [Phaeovibrio sulfidiphilus]